MTTTATAIATLSDGAGDVEALVPCLPVSTCSPPHTAHMYVERARPMPAQWYATPRERCGRLAGKRDRDFIGRQGTVRRPARVRRRAQRAARLCSSSARALWPERPPPLRSSSRGLFCRCRGGDEFTRLIVVAIGQGGQRHGRSHTKLAASSVLPTPVYWATSGYGHRGRVRSIRPSVR